ncbi:MAG: carbon storage regulator [Gammaproteobacteria bacterium]|nr:MAG: carbon storage regulator [Gammaproteobacteria bacterium]
MALILSRKPRQDIRIGPDTRIRVLAVSGEEVLLGIEARPETRIIRQELEEAYSGGRPAPGTYPRKSSQGREHEDLTADA